MITEMVNIHLHIVTVSYSKIHRLTQAANTPLRVDLADFEGGTRYAKYNTFQIQDPSSKYQLNITGYSGTAGDDLIATHNAMKFTTRDQDNDEVGSENCAIIYKRAWWYKDYHSSNLNGRYLSGNHTAYADGIERNAWKGHYYSLKITEMKIC